MKEIVRFFKLLIVFVCLLVLAVIAFLNYNTDKYGPDFVEAKLSESLGQPVFVGRVAYIPPFGVAVYDVLLDDDSQVHTLKVQFDLKELIQGQLQIGNVLVYRPDINISPQMLLPKEEPKTVKHSEELSGLFTRMNDLGSERCKIVKLSIIEGKMRYSKVLKSLMGLSRFSRKTFDLENFELVAENFSFPLSSERVPFRFLSRFTKETSGPLSLNNIEAKGWVDFVGKNMDAVIDMKRPDGKRALSAKVVSEKNKMKVEGQVDHKTYSSGVKERIVQQDKGFNTVLDSVMTSVDIDDIVDFSFTTEMDKPRIDKVKFSGGLAKSWP